MTTGSRNAGSIHFRDDPDLISFSLENIPGTPDKNKRDLSIPLFRGAYEIRTRDPLLAKQVLSQLS